MPGPGQSPTGGNNGGLTEAALASLRSKASGPAKDFAKSLRENVGKAFQSGHNSSGWDRKARWQRAFNLAREKMGVSGMDESVDKWGCGGPKDEGGADRRVFSAQTSRRGSINLGTGGGGAVVVGSPGTIAELRTPVALKEHLKRGRGERETGLTLATLEVGLDAPELSEQDAAALVAQYDQRRQMLGGTPASLGRPAVLSPADRALRAWTNTGNITTSSNANTSGGGGGGNTGSTDGGSGGISISSCGGGMSSSLGGGGPDDSGSSSASGSISCSGAAVVNRRTHLGFFRSPSMGSCMRGTGAQPEGGVAPLTTSGTPPAAAAGAAVAAAPATPAAGPCAAFSPLESGGGGLVPPRRFSECGGVTGLRKGSNMGGVAQVGSLGNTYLAGCRSALIPSSDAPSVVGRTMSVRRESVATLRVCLDSSSDPAADAGEATDDVVAPGGAVVVSRLAPEGTTPVGSGATPTPLTARSRVSFSLRSSGALVPPPWEHTPSAQLSPSAGATDVLTTVGGGCGSGGVGLQLAPLRPGSAARRMPPQAQPSLAAPASAEPAAAAAADSSGGDGGDDGAVGALPSPLTTPQEQQQLLRRSVPRSSLPQLQMPPSPSEDNATPLRLTDISEGGGGEADAEGVHWRRLSSPAYEAVPSVRLLAAASPNPAGSDVATPPAATAVANAAVGGMGYGSATAPPTAWVPAPPPPLPLSHDTSMLGPRRPRMRATVTGDGSGSPQTGPTHGSLPAAPLTTPVPYQAWMTTSPTAAAPAAHSGAASAASPTASVGSPDPTPPASPRAQRLMQPPPAVLSSLASASATAAAGTPAGSAGAPPASALIGTPRLTFSPSSPWPSAYRRSTASSPGTAPGNHLPGGPQPPASPQPMHRPQPPSQSSYGPYSPNGNGGVLSTSLGYRRSTPNAAGSSLGGGAPWVGTADPAAAVTTGGPTGLLGSRPSALSQSSHALQPSAFQVQPAGTGVGVRSILAPSPLAPSDAMAATADAVAGSPSRFSPTLGSGSPAGRAAAAAGGGLKYGNTGVRISSGTGGGGGAAVRTPVCDGVLTDLRAVATEAAAELGREAEVAVAVRQVSAQALRNRIRVSDSGRLRNAAVSMPGDPWRKW